MHKVKPGVVENPARRLKLGTAIIPVVIGLGVVAYLLYSEFNPDAFSLINFTWRSFFWILVAILFMAGRDIGYTLRLVTLTDGKFNFRKAFRVIMLWEFTSAITPSAVGGTSIAIVYVNKEGLNLGHSSAVVMITSFLDELYFILMFPLLILLVGASDLFGIAAENSSIIRELVIFSVVGYSVKFVWVLILSYGLFVNPRGLKWLLMIIFKLPLLRRWKHGANRAGTDIISSSKEYRRKPFSFWAKAFGSTFLSWTSRFWIVNALLLAFFTIDNHLLVFARQLVMWIMMLVSPTPGGSGFAEFVFTRYLSEFIPVDASAIGAIAVGMALLWRFVSYYPYLFVGAIIFPRWIRSKFLHGEQGK
ncbi:MAG: flippase-like domain-containing protein [Bacteroidales bacterium]|nr:MAG: flippase-like domain-containing protein [Bacteroidales bacterium]